MPNYSSLKNEVHKYLKKTEENGIIEAKGKQTLKVF